MAKVLGESGRYVSQEATKRLHATWKLAVITMTAIGCIFGFMVRSYFPLFGLGTVSHLLLCSALLLLMWLAGRSAFGRMSKLDKERENMLRGVAGERSVAHTLSKLPDEFLVVNDVQTPNEIGRASCRERV